MAKTYRFACFTLSLYLLNVHAARGFSPSAATKAMSTTPIRQKMSPSKKHSLQNTRGGGLKAWPLTKDPKGMSPDYPLAAGRIAITIASTFFTWYAQKTNQYSSVMASSAFTLVCSMCFDRRLGQAAFCGSFAGMSSLAVIPSWRLALALGGMTSFFFEALIHYRNAFLGVGGRLGATAFIATSLVAAMTSIPTGFSLGAISLKYTSTVASMAFWHALGSIGTIVLREVSDDSAAADPVRASAVIGLIGALLLEDKTAALAVYGGSFAGMSLPSRLMYGILPGQQKSESGVKSGNPTTLSLLSAFTVAGAIGGIVHGATIDLGFWPGGWGGKAGSCAFVGCLIYRGCSKMLASLTPKRSGATSSV
uniref:Uncharacterized protein n=1 Tax=Chaetoceros debilis TaxID=122233 RepID=A0A7S3V4J0_9STRA|mmetsp:Transcript_22663/g.34569  ORF Transcript_22663/g.34569 Transcript_22663/m.34569 type:complete len:365 (+) Transcript_22663:72-1166(+)|eukprot:CAMPEP_0194109886 /NCGR_PEP_ID=MMETSP0150-20130528/9285_1 /TAXON_ID=122233 /ORGANISM="Chaetoceros debilis, Strain MM31A-1" /LENGTH=364 /DNA_ID=CAMNT_0038798941 /DNA_START=87 /DNA_END=1181 /DNA_ORIENTATION=+